MIRLSILTDNHSRSARYVCEHGLSVHVATDHVQLLLDTGQSAKCLHNAAAMNIDLTRLDAVLISHGHYDHAGGLGAVLDVAKNAVVAMHEAALKPKYSVSAKMIKPNGFPNPDVLKKAKVKFVQQTLRLSGEVELFTLPFPAPENKALVQENSTPDPFDDEVYALINDGRATVLYGGCTHHGIGQVLDYVFRTYALEHLDAYVGGLHLKGRAEDEIQKAIKSVSAFDVRHWIVNHCTGDEAVAQWRASFKDKCHDGWAGDVVEV